MNGMFQDCSALTKFDLSGFNTSNVSNMNDMFRNCSSLTSLNISNFNIETGGTKIIFYGCDKLISSRRRQVSK